MTVPVVKALINFSTGPGFAQTMILDTGLLDENSSFNISSSDTFTIHDFLSRYFSIHSHKKFTWRTMPPGATI